jgi:hypothetical protein
MEKAVATLPLNSNPWVRPLRRQKVRPFVPPRHYVFCHQGCLRSIGNPSCPISSLYPRCSIKCFVPSWQGLHSDWSLPSRNEFQFPRCGSTWSTTVASTARPRVAHMAQKGCSPSWWRATVFQRCRPYHLRHPRSGEPGWRRRPLPIPPISLAAHSPRALRTAIILPCPYGCSLELI